MDHPGSLFLESFSDKSLYVIVVDNGFLVLAANVSSEDAVKMCRWFQVAVLHEDHQGVEEVLVPVDAAFAASWIEHRVFWFGPSPVDEAFVKAFTEEIREWEVDMTESDEDSDEDLDTTEPFWSDSSSSVSIIVMKSAFAEC